MTTTKMTTAEAVAKLQAVIAAYPGDKGPGIWTVTEYRGNVRMTYTLPVHTLSTTDRRRELYWAVGPHPDLQSGDEPWEKWGGNVILAWAQMEKHYEFHDFPPSTHVNESGEKIYTDSVLLRY